MAYWYPEKFLTMLSKAWGFYHSLDDEELKKMGYNAIEIAKLEFKQGLIPITVKRPMPGAIKKDVPVKPFDQTKLE